MANYLRIALIAECNGQRIQFCASGNVKHVHALHTGLFIFDEYGRITYDPTEGRNPVHIWNKVLQENGFTTRIIAKDDWKEFDRGDDTLEWEEIPLGTDAYVSIDNEDGGFFRFKGFNEIPRRLLEKLLTVSPYETVFKIFDGDDEYSMEFQDWYAWTDEEREGFDPSELD